jgi:hypothetical protein
MVARAAAESMLPARTLCATVNEEEAKDESRTPEATSDAGGRGLDGSEGVAAGDVACGESVLDTDELLDRRVLGDAVSIAEDTTATDGVDADDLVAAPLPLEARLAELFRVCVDSAVGPDENDPEALADCETLIDRVSATLALRVAGRDAVTTGVPDNVEISD